MKTVSSSLCLSVTHPRVLRVSSIVLTLAALSGAGVAASGAASRRVAPADKILLAYRAKAGQVKHVKGEATLTFEVEGEKAKLDVKETGTVTYKTVTPSGEITFEDQTDTSEATFNGEKAGSDDEKKSKPDIVTLRPDGTMVAYKDGDADDAEKKDETHIGARMSIAGRVTFPDKPVGPGDTWTRDFKADTALGSREAKGEYEFVAVEKVNGVDCAKIKMSYTESGKSPALSVKGTEWVDLASGDVVSADIQVDNVPFGDDEDAPLASGTFHEERVDGSPLGATEARPTEDAKKGDAKPGDKPAVPAKPGDKKPDVPAAVAKKDEPKKEEPKKDKTIDEVVKDYEKLPGLLTLYRKKEAGKDTIYAEVREDQLGKLMMLQTTASTGDSDHIVAGNPINDLLFKFIRNGDDKLVLAVPNYKWRAENKEIARAIRRSFADAYLVAYKIEAKQAERKTLLIDISDLFRSDLTQVSSAFGGGMPGASGYGLDREKTFIQTVKNFPDNLVVSTQYHFMRGVAMGDAGALADVRSAPIIINFNLFALPTDNGYQPRLADPRIGYFIEGSEYRSFDSDTVRDPQVRFINRWDLRKKDTKAALSEPVKPLVFWLDNAIPVAYRPAVSDGILMWNKAFEKVGFKNAVVVKQMPDNADFDHADMRYNVIRWVVSPDQAYAVALFRVNPLTGQMLNASITVDAGIIRAFKLERTSQVEPAASAFERGAGMDNEVLLGNLAANSAKTGKTPDALLREIALRCQFAAGPEFKRQAWMGYQTLSLLAPGANPLLSEKQYADQIIRETVAHEMGHILGLRHNFIASTEFSLEELKNPQTNAAGGIGASVMDYNPFNIAALKSRGATFFSQTLGSYDYWAIQYGYTPIAGATNPTGELYALGQIAKRSNERGHAYQSDEQAMLGFDPMVSQYDLSSDPLAYWQRMMTTSRYLLTKLDQREPKTGQSYYEFTRAFEELLNVYAGAAGSASRFVGGLRVNRNHKGDPGEKPTLAPMDVAEQKRALNLLNTYIFAPKAFQFPLSYYGKLTGNPNDFEFGTDFPVQDQLSGVQKAALRRLFSPLVLGRVANNEFKRGGDPKEALTLPYLFRSVGANVWAELAAKKNVPTLRRQLQRQYVDTMVDLASGQGGGTPDDARMLAWNELRQMKAKLVAANAGGASYDEYTRLHLQDSLVKIKRVLDARMTLGQSGGGGGGLLQLLMGGREATGASQTP